MPAGKFLLIYICNFHVLSNLLLIFMCKLHWILCTRSCSLTTNWNQFLTYHGSFLFSVFSIPSLMTCSHSLSRCLRCIVYQYSGTYLPSEHELAPKPFQNLTRSTYALQGRYCVYNLHVPEVHIPCWWLKTGGEVKGIEVCLLSVPTNKLWSLDDRSFLCWQHILFWSDRRRSERIGVNRLIQYPVAPVNM